MKNTLFTFPGRMILIITLVCIPGFYLTGNCQTGKRIVFDGHHIQAAPEMIENFAAVYKTMLPENSGAVLIRNDEPLSDEVLSDIDGLILILPAIPFQEDEKQAIIEFLNSGGSLLLLFDEESRTPLKATGVNDFLKPFDIELTGDIPARHNCGAIAEKSEVCAEKRELPYSGGRSIKGGTVVSRVYDDGDYVHCAYVRLPSGGKIIVMSDAMAGLLLGGPDGERFSGSGPQDSRFWGKDSRVFMEEILAFLLKD